MTDLPSERRRGRFWLYAPFALLVLLALAWSGFWFVVKGRVVEGLDRVVAREAQMGRTWTCSDRSVAGFPFRIEVRCAGLTLTSSRWGDTVKVETGPSVAVGQIYTPGLVILEVKGPLQAALPEGRKLDLGWSQLEASLALKEREPERFSMVLVEPNATLTAPGASDETWRANQLDVHLRRNPARFATEQVADLALTAKGSVLPALDALLGTTEPGDVEMQASLTQSLAFKAGFNPDALEAWRTTGGQIELMRLLMTKGAARLEASGRLLLDQTHRLSGQIDAGVAGIDRIGGIKLGGLAAGLGGLLGGKPSGGTPGLTPLPPVVLREGRVYLGPFRLPLQPLAPLY
ncbi:DUF2125 domain-containing protein [Bosea sp. 2YAB26]|uniref:DUF2125 domain-containing protein n=1 Tax=Bosea sp. 2YAB26 TaxID=3237478 RepID=UPI003F91C011